MKNRFLPVFCWLVLSMFWSTPQMAQHINLRNNDEAISILHRLSMKYGLAEDMHLNLQPALRSETVVQARKLLENDSLQLDKRDIEDIQYIFDDNNEWLTYPGLAVTVAGKKYDGTMALESIQSPYYRKSKKPILGLFYKTPPNLFEVNKKDFFFRVNPMLNGQIGVGQGDNDSNLFLNQRGLEMKGGLDDRVFVYFNVLESQAAFPSFVDEFYDKFNSIPGAGSAKKYTSDIFNISDGYDFLTAQAYLGFNLTKHLGVQFGHGKHFIGNGYRSLLLSDFSNNYFFLKLNWRVWNFQLQNIFAELQSERLVGDRGFARKYMAAHTLSYNITPKLNVSFFESVIFSRNNQFELQYLNPLILYRTVELLIGSPDNVLIGFDARYNVAKNVQLYGQWIFDEFKFDELTANTGWWANKYGWQLGAKYVDVGGVSHLDFQVEWNQVRPYTYSHRDSAANYSHFKQSLAHPLGANFKELVTILNYKPSKRWTFNLRYIYMYGGEDPNRNTNWGSNINLPNVEREMDYGNEIGQGATYTTNLFSAVASYQVFHNAFIFARIFSRDKVSDLATKSSNNLFFSLGVRLNSPVFQMDF
ncbi:MAG: hypothetical protein KDC24_06345 [Saprospiraceae bacterium]|nr:hypothetical protein [Saprospiraceae bacterium]